MKTSGLLPEECKAEKIRRGLIAYCVSRIDDLAHTQMPKEIRDAPDDRKEMRRRQIRGRILELRKLKNTLEQKGIGWVLNDKEG